MLRKKVSAIGIEILLLCCLSSCEDNEPAAYWRNSVEKNVYGREYVNFRVAVEEYSVCKGEIFDSLPTDTIEVHVTPRGIYTKDRYCFRLVTDDSIFVYHLQDGNYTYGRTTGLKSKFEERIYSGLYDRRYRQLEELLPFYLYPQRRSSFRIRRFSGMNREWGHAILQYKTKRDWKERFLDGVPFENSESMAAWIDTSTGLVDRVRQTIHMTSEGIAPADDILDMRIISVNFEEASINESLYRRDASVDKNIAFYNMNSGECSPSIISLHVEEENVNGFLDAPIVNASLDTTTLRKMEGWVLVEMWTHGCKPCAMFAEQLKKEQATLGYRILEHEGIKVVCLNPCGLVTDAFRSYVRKYNIQDIAYSARAVSESINVRGYPYYFLISPDKEIVFRDNYLGENYERIRDIKNKSQESNNAVIQFDSDVYNYDTIDYGSDGRCSFSFRNIGHEPLIISGASSSCGCTTPEFDAAPIMPGKSGTIRVKYDTNTPGSFRKTVVVKSNAANAPTSVLRIQGYVREKGKGQAVGAKG